MTSNRVKQKTSGGAFGATWQRVSLIVTFIIMLVVNGLAGSTTVIGGVDTATISDSYPNLFAPAGITFSIWGVIYVLLIGYVAAIALGLPKKRNMPRRVIEQTIPLVITSCLLNTAWLLAWQHRLMGVSVLIMGALLGTLIQITLLIRPFRLTGWEYGLFKLPFSVYAGWICVATIANVTTWLVSIHWDGWWLNDVLWMLVMLVLGAVIGVATALHHRDVAYLAVFAWAYSGIALKHIDVDGFHYQYPSVIATVIALLAAYIFAAAWIALTRSVRKRRH